MSGNSYGVVMEEENPCPKTTWAVVAHREIGKIPARQNCPTETNRPQFPIFLRLPNEPRSNTAAALPVSHSPGTSSPPYAPALSAPLPPVLYYRNRWTSGAPASAN
jgi:hypothetical protein